MKNFIIQMDEQVGKLFGIQEVLEKRRHDYGTGDELTMREVHVIEAIGSYPNHKAAELIEMLGILKGTFSKTALQLEKRELILRYNRPGNNRDVYYKLTEQGKRVFDCHYAYHEARSARIYSIFRSYTPEEQELVLRFLHDYGEYLNDYL